MEVKQVKEYKFISLEDFPGKTAEKHYKRSLRKITQQKTLRLETPALPRFAL